MGRVRKTPGRAFASGLRLGIKEGSLGLGGGRLGTMETQRASLSLGRWSLWLLLLGLALPSASAQALSYREAVLRAVDQFNERSSEANLYRLLELDPPLKEDVSWGGGWEGDLSPDILGHTVAPSLRLVLLSGRHFSHYVGSHLF